LTEQQAEALELLDATGAVYDDSPWTREELQALAWERVQHESWDKYDELPDML
jgi:hypothetical protein